MSADLTNCLRFCTIYIMHSARKKALDIIRHRGGIIRTREALALGIHRRTLYSLRNEGEIVPVTRGLYRIAEMEIPAQVNMVDIAKRVPKGVICLLSALSFHELTTQIPHQIWIAIDRKARKPKIAYPPVRVFHFSGASFTEGVETHSIMKQKIQIYSSAKTVIDCFRWKNEVGLDVAIEAAKDYLSRRDSIPSKLMEYAQACKVEKLVRPYLEALVA